MCTHINIINMMWIEFNQYLFTWYWTVNWLSAHKGTSIEAVINCIILCTLTVPVKWIVAIYAGIVLKLNGNKHTSLLAVIWWEHYLLLQDACSCLVRGCSIDDNNGIEAGITIYSNMNRLEIMSSAGPLWMNMCILIHNIANLMMLVSCCRFIYIYIHTYTY